MRTRREGDGAGNDRVFVTERGFTFGYNNLVVDMRAFPMMRELGVPVVFDVTHSLQLPGAGDGVTAGLAQYIEPLASAGVGRRRGRRLPRSARRSVEGAERRAERARARRAGAAARSTRDRTRSPISPVAAGTLVMAKTRNATARPRPPVLETEARAILS
jgi:hypothetical protein